MKKIIIETQEQANNTLAIINEILASDNGIKDELDRHRRNIFKFDGNEFTVDRVIEPKVGTPFKIYKWSKPRLQILKALGLHARALHEFEELDECLGQLEKLGVNLEDELGEF